MIVGARGSDEQRPKESIYTIGHSTRTIEEFLGLLAEHAVDLLVDVRTIPKSRRHPQFGQEALGARLRAVGIEYLHCKDLGGLRRPVPVRAPGDGARQPHGVGGAPGDAAAVDAEFFEGTSLRSLLVVNLGHPGEDAWYDRLPR